MKRRAHHDVADPIVIDVACGDRETELRVGVRPCRDGPKRVAVSETSARPELRAGEGKDGAGIRMNAE